MRSNSSNAGHAGRYQNAPISATMPTAAAAFFQFPRANQRKGRATKKGKVHFVRTPMPATTPKAIVQPVCENRFVRNNEIGRASCRERGEREVGAGKWAKQGAR